ALRQLPADRDAPGGARDRLIDRVRAGERAGQVVQRPGLALPEPERLADRETLALTGAGQVVLPHALVHAAQVAEAARLQHAVTERRRDREALAQAVGGLAVAAHPAVGGAEHEPPLPPGG